MSERDEMGLGLQLFGLLIVLASFAYWLLSKHEAVVMIGAGMSLIGLGTFLGLDRERKGSDGH